MTANTGSDDAVASVLGPESSLFIPIIFYSISGMSVISMASTLVLLKWLGRWNGYTLLIAHLATSEIAYIAFLVASISQPLPAMFVFRNLFSLVAIFWTNIRSFVVFYVVTYLRIFDTVNRLYRLVCLVYAPSILVSVLSQTVFQGNSNAENPAYLCFYILQMLSIVVNVVLYSAVVFFLNLRTSRDEEARNNDPVRLLADRLKWYPVVQVISRAPAAWYGPVFGQFDGRFFNISGQGNFQAISTLICAITIASSGVGIFLIFVNATPGAYMALSQGCYEACYILGIRARPTDDDISMDFPRQSILSRSVSRSVSSRSTITMRNSGVMVVRDTVSIRGLGLRPHQTAVTFDAYRNGENGDNHLAVVGPFHSDNADLCRPSVTSNGSFSEHESRVNSVESFHSTANDIANYNDPTLNTFEITSSADSTSGSGIEEGSIGSVRRFSEVTSAEGAQVVDRGSFVEMAVRHNSNSDGNSLNHSADIANMIENGELASQHQPQHASSVRNSEIDGVMDYSDLDELGLDKAIERIYGSDKPTSTAAAIISAVFQK